MLTVVSGPFHPGLEKAFIERIRELKKDPLVPVAVVAPSSRLVDRLQTAATERSISALNLHFFTFSSLAEFIVTAEGPLDKPILSDPLFFDTLVKQIIKDDKPFEAFEDLAVPDGFPPAVRGTLRDLLDAGINQENVEELIQEGFAGKDVDLGSLRSLLNLHRKYLERISQLPVWPRAELLNRAIRLAPASKALGNFKEILYYGFYDLTGLQADFFQAVTKNFPSRFFFPYVRGHAAYAFAQRFRDIFVQPVMKEEVVLPEQVNGHSRQFLIRNVSGLRDEAWFIANEVRRLHDEEKIPFQEIAVVARLKGRLGFLIQEAFADRGIPFRPSTYPHLLDFPPVLEAWRLLSEHKPAEPAATWSEFIAAAQVLLTEQLKDSGLWEKLADGLKRLDNFSHINKRIAWDEFVETLRDRWASTEVREGGWSQAGVSLLYAEAARGLPFRAVFLAGLEEKVFPRAVKEDPFLRDEAREALNGIGHKISKKMTALEEERLLFELLTGAASERLYLLHQRSDDEGSVVGTSPFLRSFAQEHGLSLDDETVSVPRSLLEKIKSAAPSTLGLSDVMIGFLSAKKEEEALGLAQNLGLDREGLKAGLKLQKEVHAFDAPGAYDAVVGPLETSQIFPSGRISATDLETYFQCGFKFFAGDVLNLRPRETAELEEKLAPDFRGKQVHKFVEAFFRRVTAEGAQPVPPKVPKQIFEEAFKEFFPPDVPAEARLHPLLWQATRASLEIILAAFLEAELATLHSEGSVPSFFEVVVEAKLPPPLDAYRWTGKIDRIDLKKGSVEVLDYKTGRPFDKKNIAPLALKGEKLQAPIYLLLAKNFLEKAGKTIGEMSFRYEFIGHSGQARRLSAEEWQTHSKGILAAVKALLDSVHQGVFVMKPGRHCDYCEVSRICRHQHGISIYRNRQPVKAS